MAKVRCEQDSNLRGKLPLDFKSNALTTRPSQPCLLFHGRGCSSVVERSIRIRDAPGSIPGVSKTFWPAKKWACPGVEPGTSRTLSENHTPRPPSRCVKVKCIVIKFPLLPSENALIILGNSLMTCLEHYEQEFVGTLFVIPL